MARERQNIVQGKVASTSVPLVSACSISERQGPTSEPRTKQDLHTSQSMLEAGQIIPEARAQALHLFRALARAAARRDHAAHIATPSAE